MEGGRILVLGAGRSSAALIDYLLKHAGPLGWKVVVGDTYLKAAEEKVAGQASGVAIQFDIEDQAACASQIQDADVVISLLPPHLHPLVAKYCVDNSKHLLTASYVSTEMEALSQAAAAKDLVLVNECGLDPGIDHMSAMQVIDRIRRQGGEMISFESFTGGLIAPETDPANPWRYKFTWNPRNVVMAGQGTAKFLEDGRMKYIPYQQLFTRTTRVTLPELGNFEGYANRDSLSYRKTYGLENISTMLRGTLRHEGFCSAWNILVQLGATDDTYRMEGVGEMTHHDFIDAFLPAMPGQSAAEKIVNRFKISFDGAEMSRLKWSGLFSDEKIGLSSGTPAQLLEFILNKKWALQQGDRDRIVMWHRFRYAVDGVKKEIQATLVADGDNSLHTAMAKTVGLPLAIAARLVLQKQIKSRGVVVPTRPEFYLPILKELDELGVRLTEREIA